MTLTQHYVGKPISGQHFLLLFIRLKYKFDTMELINKIKSTEKVLNFTLQFFSVCSAQKLCFQQPYYRTFFQRLIKRTGKRYCTNVYFCFVFVFLSGFFFSRTFKTDRTAGERGGYFLNSSLSLPSASQTLRHQPGNYCKELTSVHSQQADSNWELLVSEHQSLTTKLRAIRQCLINDTCSKRNTYKNLKKMIISKAAQKDMLKFRTKKNKETLLIQRNLTVASITFNIF